MNRYQNLDVELSRYRKEGERELVRSRVMESPAGGQRDAEAIETAFGADLRSLVSRMDRRDLELDDLISLGEELAALLLPAPARALYERSLDRLADNEGLRIRIRLDVAELESLPWEYAYVRSSSASGEAKRIDGFLALDRRISVVRFEVLRQPTPILKPPGDSLTMVAVFAAVESADYARLDLDSDERNLKQALEAVPGLEAHYLRPGTVEQLGQALGGGSHIFHFSGHGRMVRSMGAQPGEVTSRGELAFATESGEPHHLDAEELAANLKGRGVRLAVLAACESARQEGGSASLGVAAALVRNGLPAVVGMQLRMADQNAIAFGRAIFGALAEGRSIDSAVSEGRIAILNLGGAAERDWGVPVLHLRSDQSFLFPPSQKWLRINLTVFALSLLVLAWTNQWHVAPWLGQRYSELGRWFGVGTTAVLALLASARAVWAYTSRVTRSERASRIDAALRRPVAVWGFGSLLVIALVLAATTSSIYLRHDGAGSGVEVRLEADGKPFSPFAKLEADPGHPVAGGPLFFGAWKEAPRLVVVRPSGARYLGAVPRRLVPFKSWALDYPAAFKGPRILRVVPTLRLLNVLPGSPPPDSPRVESPYRLQVKVGDAEPVEVADLRQSIVYLGAASKDALKQHAALARNDQRLGDALERCQHLDSDASTKAEIRAMWDREPLYLELPDLTEEAVVGLKAGRLRIDGMTWLATTDVAPGSSPPIDDIETICLPPSQP